MIPAEAVEAAAKAIFGVDDATWDLQIQDVRDSYLEDAKNALEAAAPYIRARALNEAAGALEMQPPQLRAQYVYTLRLFAVEPWRLTTCPSECAATHPGREHGEINV